MFKKSVSISLLLAIGIAVVTASQGDSAAKKAGNVLAEPRLLWFKNGDNKHQQPIVIVQQPHSESDRHHHHHPPPYWADYYPPTRPQRPPFQIPGYPGLSDYPSIVIINPNNAQNLTFPAAPAAAAAGTGTGTGGRSASRRASNPIADLLQESILNDDTEVINAPDNTEAEGEVALAQLLPQAHYAAEERDEDYAGDELALLERQAARGLNPKHLFSLLSQDKKRRRFQEAVAGIYLRNYNLNRK